jgi:hypothetical protein
MTPRNLRTGHAIIIRLEGCYYWGMVIKSEKMNSVLTVVTSSLLVLLVVVVTTMQYIHFISPCLISFVDKL